jgi:hypothetical protein
MARGAESPADPWWYLRKQTVRETYQTSLRVMVKPDAGDEFSNPGGSNARPAVSNLFSLLHRDYPKQETEVRAIEEIHAQFEMLEALRSKKRPSSRFAKPELTHRAESLVSGADRDPVDMVLRRTAALLRDIQRMRSVRDLSAEQKALDTLMEESRRIAPTDVPSRQILHLKCCELRRRIAFANPLLDFDRILFVTHKRNRRGELGGDHMAGQYYGTHASKGEGLFALDNAFGDRPVARNLLTNAVCANGRFAGSRLPDGAYLSPDLSFDGREVLFAYTEAAGYQPTPKAPEDSGGMYSYSGLQCSFTKANCWHIFKVNVDGTGLHNVTDGPWNDFDPCWMPNGRIAFISDRRGGFGRCHMTANGGAPWFTYTLHSVNPDGSLMTRLSHHETCEWQPSVTHEGLLVYTRWDYVDRGFFQAHHPWTTTPDGRMAQALHGNYPADWRNRPCMEMDIRSVPHSHRLVATAAAHHGQTYGSIVLVDPHVEDDDAMSPVRLVTPDERFPESEYGYFCREAAYATPWPLSEDYHLCVYGYPEPGQKDGSVENYGIYLLDAFGNKELLYRDPAISCLSPIPVKNRRTPPVIPDQVTPCPVDPNQRRINLDRPAVMTEAVIQQTNYAATLDKAHGTVMIANVYESRHQWPKDTRIAALRVIQVLPKSAPGRDNPKIGYGTEKNARVVLGTVPVEADGSVALLLPPYVPVYFQVLNDQGIAVQSMRTDVYVAPNEKLTCAGCHERRTSAPPVAKALPLAFRKEPSALVPGPDGTNPFSFLRLVQPVLDAKCVACHVKPAAGDPAAAANPKAAGDPKSPDPADLLDALSRGSVTDGAAAQLLGEALTESAEPKQAHVSPAKPTLLPLSADPRDKRGWTTSYRSLQRHAFFFSSGSFTESKTIPGAFGALASRLYAVLQKGHHGVKLTPEELGRIALWLDCNSDFYGAYDRLDMQARGEIVKSVLE